MRGLSLAQDSYSHLRQWKRACHTQIAERLRIEDSLGASSVAPPPQHLGNCSFRGSRQRLSPHTAVQDDQHGQATGAAPPAAAGGGGRGLGGAAHQRQRLPLLHKQGPHSTRHRLPPGRPGGAGKCRCPSSSACDAPSCASSCAQRCAIIATLTTPLCLPPVSLQDAFVVADASVTLDVSHRRVGALKVCDLLDWRSIAMVAAEWLCLSVGHFPRPGCP